MSWLRFFKNTLSFDYRSLALYRFFIGLIVMADVVYRWEDLQNFYTDVGLIPRSIFTSEMTMPWSFSLHLANGSLPVIKLLFLIHFIVGVMLVLGYKTRWAMLGAYVLTVSVHNRNWLVNNGGDDVLRAIIFLSVFLPLNRCFSVDSALENKSRPLPNLYFSTWGIAFFFQAFAIYFFSYILKNHPIWRSEFTAVFYASRLDIFATPLGVLGRQYPFLQKLTTIVTIYMEWLGPLVLVFGALVGKKLFWWLRTLLVFAFIGFHFGIFLTMKIGLFPFIAMVMWLIFLPEEFWNRIQEYFRKKNFGKLAVYFDGDCSFCQKSVRILREFFLLPEVKLAPAQDQSEINNLMQKNNSWVVVTPDGKKHFHYQGFVELVKHSPLLLPFKRLAQSAVVSKLGGKVYHWVSHNRMEVGKITQFLDYGQQKKEVKLLRWGHELTGGFIFLTLLIWNMTTLKFLNYRAPFYQNVARWVHLYQEWNMFSPFPKRDNIWVEVPGVLSDGSEIELITGSKDIYSIKDQEFYRAIPNEHWRKFYLNMSDRTDYARYYGGYLCRTWNDLKVQHVPGTTLRKMEIMVYSQPNLPDGGKGKTHKKLSWKHWCFKEDMRRDLEKEKNEPKSANPL